MRCFLICILMALFTTSTFAMPKAVILIRHAEKPTPEDSSPSLSEKGWQRAKLLPQIFVENKALSELGLPDYLFAAGLQKDDSSKRSIETLTYLSKNLQIPINDSFKRDDFQGLTEEILENPIYDNKVIMICWQHKILSKIAKHLGVNPKPEYNDQVFDRIWLITYLPHQNSEQVSFKDMPQHLLPGDSEQ